MEILQNIRLRSKKIEYRIKMNPMGFFVLTEPLAREHYLLVLLYVHELDARASVGFWIKFGSD